MGRIRIIRCAARARRGILFLDLSLAILWFFNEGFRVKLPGEIFDCRDDPRRGPTASTMLHPGRVASVSTAGEAESERESAKTRKSGCSRATSSRLTWGQSCSESTTETAPALRRASAIKVPLPTEMSG